MTRTETNFPLLTVGFVSCNRYHYLRAAIESARRCIQYQNVQWIVVDNASVEPGLREYLRDLHWLDENVLEAQRSPLIEHITALNTIVRRASGEYLLILPDDVQFIVEGKWMYDCVELLRRNPWLGSISVTALRRCTTQDHFSWRRWLDWRDWTGELREHGPRFRRQHALRSSSGTRFRSFGWRRPGINGVGMLTVTPTEIWKRLGPWKIQDSGRAKFIDSSGGGEDEMLARYARSGYLLHMAMPVIPVACSIITDPIGTNAKVRGDRRYGVYMAPSEGNFYYRIYREEELQEYARRDMPLGIEDYVEPLGFRLPIDHKGNVLKVPINMSVEALIS